MYARIEDGMVAAYPVDPRAENPATSFPWDWAGGIVSGAEYARIIPTDVPQVSYTKNFSEGTPAFVESVWMQTWVVSDATPEQITQRVADQWSRVRAERNARLAACDWTQLADASVNAAAWTTYRQALRDLPQTQTDPFNIVWPTSP